MSFTKDVKAMGIKEVLSAPRSPWQRAYVERVSGTISRGTCTRWNSALSVSADPRLGRGVCLDS